MKSTFTLLITCFLLALLLIACDQNENVANNDTAVTSAATDLPTDSGALSISAKPTNLHATFDVFSKYVNVFGVHILASDDVPDQKVLHAANVMAQYLDNDADGKPDNQAVVDAMVTRNAFLIMFNEEGTEDEEQLFEADIPFPGQNLYGSETRPNGRANGEFDTTLEEVLHLITYVGYANAYPDVWGEESGTAVAEAMDVARGGHFEEVPRNYPEEAWYTYDDYTCEYDCMITEYIYWSLTSILGAQDFPGRLDEIQHEWRLNSAEKVKSTDPTIYNLLTDPTYHFPTVLPDGNYNPNAASNDGLFATLAWREI